MSVPKGIYAASLSPFNEDLSCNTDELASHCLDLMGRGCQGVVLFGTTGEGPSFSTREKRAIFSEVRKSIDPNKIMLVNGSSTIEDTIELSLEKCLALLVAPPCFYKNVPEEGVVNYYREILKKVKGPVILYHIPQNTGVPITLGMIETLKREFPQVIGLKESEGNLAFSKEILKRFPDFQLFVGNEKQIIETMALGGSGSICGLANLYPELISSHKDPEQIEALFQAIKGKSFIPTAKAMLAEKRGEIWKRVRPPLFFQLQT